MKKKNKEKIEHIQEEYSTIKTKAMCGVRVSRKEALRALQLKRMLNKHKENRNENNN